MTRAEDSEEYRGRLEAKLMPARIRATLAFTGLYQLTHEMIKASVLDRVRGFFGYLGNGGGVWIPASGEEGYRLDVLSRDRGPFKASLLWLLDRGAITIAQMVRLDQIYEHRHALTHELGKYLVDPDFEPDIDLFGDALQILSDVMRFWTEVEWNLGTFEQIEDLDISEVVPGQIALLDICIRAYVDGLREHQQD